MQIKHIAVHTAVKFPAELNKNHHLYDKKKRGKEREHSEQHME